MPDPTEVTEPVDPTNERPQPEVVVDDAHLAELDAAAQAASA